MAYPNFLYNTSVVTLSNSSIGVIVKLGLLATKSAARTNGCCEKWTLLKGRRSKGFHWVMIV